MQIDHQTLATEYLRWQQEIKKRDSHLQRDIQGSLRDVLLGLLPLSKPRIRHLFVPTVGNWTACFDNGWKGGDCGSLIGYMTGHLKCRGVRFVAEPHTMRGIGKDSQGSWGGLIMGVYGPDSGREIGLINYDGRWKFETAGEPLPFEKLDYYQAKRVKDRFNKDIIREYLAVLDLQPFEENFYMPSDKSPAILDEKSLWGNEKFYALEDVKQYT